MSIEVVMETQGLLLPVFYLKSVIKDYLTTENSVEKILLLLELFFDSGNFETSTFIILRKRIYH